MSPEKALPKQEESSRRKLEALLLLLLLTGGDSDALLLSLPSLHRKLGRGIGAISKAGGRLADDYADEVAPDEEEPEEGPVDGLRMAAITSGLVGSALSAVITRADEESFTAAVRGAVRDVSARMDNIAATETFYGYDKRLRERLGDVAGFWEWDATLDRRTCPKCASLSGEQWTSIDDVPKCPQHARCRCFLVFRPA